MVELPPDGRDASQPQDGGCNARDMSHSKQEGDRGSSTTNSRLLYQESRHFPRIPHQNTSGVVLLSANRWRAQAGFKGGWRSTRFGFCFLPAPKLEAGQGRRELGLKLGYPAYRACHNGFRPKSPKLTLYFHKAQSRESKRPTQLGENSTALPQWSISRSK